MLKAIGLLKIMRFLIQIEIPSCLLFVDVPQKFLQNYQRQGGISILIFGSPACSHAITWRPSSSSIR
jgi:hypothetical protein